MGTKSIKKLNDYGIFITDSLIQEIKDSKINVSFLVDSMDEFKKEIEILEEEFQKLEEKIQRKKQVIHEKHFLEYYDHGGQLFLEKYVTCNIFDVCHSCEKQQECIKLGKEKYMSL